MTETIFVLSRFNVVYRWLNGQNDASVNRDMAHWTDVRIELFNQFCLPSMKAQNDTDFHWIVLFDRERSKGRLEQQISEWSNWDRFVPWMIDDVYIPKHSRESVIETVRTRGLEAPKIVTAWLDTDDIASPYYISKIRESIEPDVTAMCFPTGYRASKAFLEKNLPLESSESGFSLEGPEVLHTFQSGTSSIQIRVEDGNDLDNIDTIHRYPHNKVHLKHPVKDIWRGERHFIKIVHDEAVINTPDRWFQSNTSSTDG